MQCFCQLRLSSNSSAVHFLLKPTKNALEPQIVQQQTRHSPSPPAAVATAAAAATTITNKVVSSCLSLSTWEGYPAAKLAASLTEAAE